MLPRFGSGLLITRPRSDNPYVLCILLLIYSSGYLAGTLPAPISNLKVKKLNSHSLAVVFSGKSTPGGELHDPGKELQVPSTAREYETTSVRVSFPGSCNVSKSELINIRFEFQKDYYKAYNQVVLGYVLDAV